MGLVAAGWGAERCDKAGEFQAESMTCILATTAASDPNNWAGIKLTVLGTWDFCAPGTYRCYTVLQMCATASGSVVHPGTFQLKRLLT